MKKIKDYEIQQKIYGCQICEKAVKDIGHIRITTHNPTKKYASGHKTVLNYKIQVCEQCFNKLAPKIREFVLK